MMDTSRLVTEPNVKFIASNVMVAGALADWAKSEGLLDTLQDGNTPLGKIYLNLVRNETGYIHDHSLDSETPEDLLPEFAGRFCYRSFSKGRDTREYIGNILEQRHGSVMEHGTITLAISGVSRALTHELVRHRSGFAVSQESQRYVDAKDIRFVVPPLLLRAWGGLDCSEAEDWYGEQIRQVESYETWQEYLTEFAMTEGLSKTMAKKRANEAARASLPNACETRLIWTGNYRALRHVIELRGSDGADLEIRRLSAKILNEVEGIAPRHFFDIDYATEESIDHGVPVIQTGYSKV